MCCRYDLLKVFQTGRSHMVVLTRPPSNSSPPALGVKTQNSSPADRRAEEQIADANGGTPGLVSVDVHDLAVQSGSDDNEDAGSSMVGPCVLPLKWYMQASSHDGKLACWAWLDLPCHAG